MSNNTVYLLFGFDTYYPVGGFNDLVGVFATLEEAQEAAHKPAGEYNSIPAKDDHCIIEELVGATRGHRWQLRRGAWEEIPHDEY